MIGLKKVLSLLVVSILVMGGLTLFGARTAGDEEGDLIDRVSVGVKLNLECGVSDVYEGELDTFLHPIPGPVYDDFPEKWRMELGTWGAGTSYSNLFINPSHEGHGTQAMEDAIDAGWIEEPEEIQWLANDVDGEWTVNPFAHNDIRFAMQYLSRENIAEELLRGYADPRYSFMDVSSEVWQAHFVEAIEEEYEMSPEGNEELMKQMIEDAMVEIKQNVAFGEVRHDGEYWQYRAPEENWRDIEGKLIGRVEDWRLDLAYYMVDILQDLGFNAWVDPTDSATAISLVFFGHPDPYDDLAYHIYTGGWISSQAKYYQEAGAAQMYAPGHGFTQTHVEEERWNYDQEGYTERVQRLDNISKRLFQGEIGSEEEYWEKKIEATQLGFEESLRVFLLTKQSLYVYNPDTLLSTVTESINGYDTYFGPRTMRTDDGTLETAVLTGVDRPYMDNWNKYGGSAYIYGEYKRRQIREYGSWMHPQTGLPMEVNVYWSEGRDTDPYERRGDVEMDYEWVDDELVENIEIPEDALDYVPGIQVEDEWEEVGEWWTRDELIAEGLIEDEYAAVKATLDVHEEHVWHDGTDFTLRDVMANYAREKRLTCPSSEPYLSSWEKRRGPWYDTIHAIEWDEQNGTYTVYGDYTLPIEDKLGSYYEIFPEVHPLTYEGWDHMHGGTEIWEISDVEETYNYEAGVADNWIHQISPTPCEDLVEVLQTMIDEEYLPCYLDEDRGAPMPANFAEVKATLESLIDFIEEYEHSYISVGPFYMEEYDTSNQTMDLERWDDYGYPFEGEEIGDMEFPYGYWAAQFEVKEVRLDSIDAPDHVMIGDDFEASGTGHYAQLYPLPDKEPLTEDNMEEYRFTLRDEFDGEILLVLDEDDITLTKGDTYSTFEAKIPTDELESEGHYSMQLEVLGVGESSFKTINAMVVVNHPDVDLNVIDFSMDEEVELGEEGNIWAEIENLGAEDDTVKIALIDEYGDEEIIYEEEVLAHDTITIDHHHTYEDMGEFSVEVWDAEDRFVDDFGTVTVLEYEIEVLKFAVNPCSGTAPLRVFIEMFAENHGTTTGKISLEVNGETIETFEISPESMMYETMVYEIEEPGDHTIAFGEEEREVTVVEDYLEPVELVVPDEVHQGDTETIQVTVDSQVEETTAHLLVGDEEYVENIEREGEVTFSVDHTFDVPGEIDVEVLDEEETRLMYDTVTVLALYELAVNVEGEGHVEWEPEEENYVEGTEVKLTALPEEGWHFIEWTGDHESTDEQTTITMDQDYEITAHFEELGTYELTVNIEGEGTTDPPEGTHIYNEGEVVTVEAVPADNWTFVNWTGDKTGDETTMNITMDSDKEITAHFSKEDPILEEEYIGTDKEWYEPGENVTIEVKNDGSASNIPMIYDFGIYIENVETGEVVYGPLEGITQPAVPDYGRTEYIIWDQTDLEGEQVPEGTYRVKAEREFEHTTEFNISEESPHIELSNLRAEPQVVKAGEEVEVRVDVTNTGYETVEYSVEFYIYGPCRWSLNESVSVTVEGGETKTVFYNYTTVDKPGEHFINVMEDDEIKISTSIEVEEDESFLDSLRTNWWLMVIVIVIVAVIWIYVSHKKIETEKVNKKVPVLQKKESGKDEKQ